MMTPTALTLRTRSRVLDIEFEDGSAFSLPFEYLRVYSPSAEVKGHGVGQEILQVGKREVGITALDPVGNYGVRPTFTDGHTTGIYTWDYLHKLGVNQAAWWADYMARLHAAGHEGDTGRDPSSAPAAAPASHGCGHHH